MVKLLVYLLLPWLLLAQAGCSLQPVQSWERGNLANPVMTRDATGMPSKLEQHTYQSKESAQGGYSIGGGGCGCN
jgi:hypothetical protein